MRSLRLDAGSYWWRRRNDQPGLKRAHHGRPIRSTASASLASQARTIPITSAVRPLAVRRAPVCATPNAIQSRSSEGSSGRAADGTGSVHLAGISAEHGALWVTVIGELAHPAAGSISGSIAIRRMADFLFSLGDDGGGGAVSRVGAVPNGAGVACSGRAPLGQALARFGLSGPVSGLLAVIGDAHGQQDQGEGETDEGEPAGGGDVAQADHRAHSPVFLCSQVKNWPTVLFWRMAGLALVASGPAIRSARALTSAPMTLAAMPAPKKCAA